MSVLVIRKFDQISIENKVAVLFFITQGQVTLSRVVQYC